MEIDKISQDDWHRALKEFRDANCFQTWEYGAVNSGEGHLSHAVLKRNGRIVGAAQVRVTTVLPGVKLAYLVDGPLWRLQAVPDDDEVFEAMVQGLVDEYAVKRGCTLKLYPFVHDNDPAARSVKKCLERHGFASNAEGPRTLVLDIAATPEELRKNLRKQWRQCLRYAEEGGLDVTIGTDRELFRACLAVYHDLHERKQFAANVRMEDFLAVHELLPEPDKMTIVAVGKEKRIDACMICSALGDTALPVLAATARSGLENHASNLVYWKMLTHLSGRGIRWFDFRGIDPQGNQGVYNFKTGVSGARGREVSALGDYMRYHGGMSRLLFKAAEWGRMDLRSLVLLQRGAGTAAGHRSPAALRETRS